MAWGLFEALGSAWEKVGGFFSGIFGRAADEGIEWERVSDVLGTEGLEFLPPELEADFGLHEQQADIAGQIAGLAMDQLIPGHLHLETERLLPTKFAYEVEITQYDAEGNPTSSPFYVGANHRLTPEEILDIADTEAEQYAEDGMVAYSVGGITASWLSGE